MTSLPAVRPARKPRKPAEPRSISVEPLAGEYGPDSPGAVLIDGTLYQYQTQPPPPADSGVVAHVEMWRYGASYSLFEHASGQMTCDCPDYVYRAEVQGRCCRHIWALMEVGALGNRPASDRAAHDDLDEMRRADDRGEMVLPVPADLDDF
jgi:hypothetical protein